MAGGTGNRTPWWAWAWSLLAWVVLGLRVLLGGNGPTTALAAFALVATVFARRYITRR